MQIQQQSPQPPLTQEQKRLRDRQLRELFATRLQSMHLLSGLRLSVQAIPDVSFQSIKSLSLLNTSAKVLSLTLEVCPNLKILCIKIDRSHYSLRRILRGLVVNCNLHTFSLVCKNFGLETLRFIRNSRTIKSVAIRSDPLPYSRRRQFEKNIKVLVDHGFFAGLGNGD